MQKKEPIMVVWCELKIPSLEISVWHHLASLVMPNSYPHNGSFNPHLTTIKDSYILFADGQIVSLRVFHFHPNFHFHPKTQN